MKNWPEGVYLATSDELPGLLAQGRTAAEARKNARDVARKLIEARREREGTPGFTIAGERGDDGSGRFTSADIHHVLFPAGAPTPATTAELKAACVATSESATRAAE